LILCFEQFDHFNNQFLIFMWNIVLSGKYKGLLIDVDWYSFIFFSNQKKIEYVDIVLT
jgi:hypothetical protein